MATLMASEGNEKQMEKQADVSCTCTENRKIGKSLGGENCFFAAVTSTLRT